MLHTLYVCKKRDMKCVPHSVFKRQPLLVGQTTATKKIIYHKKKPSDVSRSSVVTVLTKKYGIAKSRVYVIKKKKTKLLQQLPWHFLEQINPNFLNLESDNLTTNPIFMMPI